MQNMPITQPKRTIDERHSTFSYGTKRVFAMTHA
jgi:hypothetical protein